MSSLWEATNPLAGSERRRALDSDAAVDVAIVGGGFTGLWTARYLADLDPSRSVLVVEAERCGFGASGRNGGWCSALFPTSDRVLARRFSAGAAIAMRRAMQASVDEVGRAAAEDGIDCDFHKGGTLTLATNPAQAARVRAGCGGADGSVWLERDAASARVAASGLLGAGFTPHCAALHPAKLAWGLAAAVERRGVRVVEGTRVTSIDPGVVRCVAGGRELTVRADVVVRATEGFTPRLAGEERTLVPIYSLMIATEPLGDDVWDEIGLRDRETFTDGRHMIIYGQRTADGRFAFGGRGAPYHFGSAVQPSFDTDDRVFATLESTLRGLFPQIGGAAITHRWGGPLGVPRDWMASVGFDRSTGLASAGGYVGDGVSTTNLAGRTLADLISGRATDLTDLPWVDHRSPRWEPEPFRWLGINAGRAVADVVDAAEERTGRELRWGGRLMSWFSGG